MSQKPLDYQVPPPGLARAAVMAIGAGVGAAVTLPAIFLAILSGGAGHGTYLFARLLFPYAMLLTRLTGGRHGGVSCRQ